MALYRGATYFTTGTAMVNISFPEDKVKCTNCRFIKHEEALKRYSCRATDEILLYPHQGIGQQCPIVFHVQVDKGGRKDESESEQI